MYRKTWVALGVVFSVVATTVVLAVAGAERSRGGPAATGPGPTSDIGADRDKKPGHLLSAAPLTGLGPALTGGGVTGRRIVYRSTEGDTGDLTTVSGSAFVPSTDPPETGWPVVSFAHGTTGVDEPCAPSLTPRLDGLEDVVSLFTGLGFAVVLTDYQGLGEPGVHPYLDARTAGLNVIDAVRATRQAFPKVSKRWAAFGHSQGGGAAWAANEQAGAYAPELELVGAAAVAPTPDLTEMSRKAKTGTLSLAQAPALQLVLESLSRLHPEFDLDDYRKGSAVDNWEVLSACKGSKTGRRDAAISALGRFDLGPRSPEAASALDVYLRAWSLPQRKLTAPLLVAYGAKDIFFSASATTRAIKEACRLGGVVEATLEPDKGHADVDPVPAIQWVRARLSGMKAPTACSS